MYILHLQIYVYKLWERKGHENWSRTCRAFASPSQLLFFRFSPDGIDKSILSGLVACAELCKIFLLVCRCCKITFPFSEVMFRAHIRMKERVRKGPSLPWGTCPHKRRNGKSSGIQESQVLTWCGSDHVYVMSMHDNSWNTNIAMAQKMTRIPAHSSLGGPPTSNLGTQKARTHMLPNCWHGAWARLWSQREWLATLDLPTFPWRKKWRAFSPTVLLVDLLPQI